MKIKQSLLLLSIALLPLSAQAHIGHLANEELGIIEGIAHPITGIDHLCMFVVAGIILSITNKKILSLSSVILGLVMGIFAGSLIHANATLEYTVAFSLLGLVFLLFTKKYIKFSVYILPVMAFVHGLAHGTEIPTGLATSFTIGSAISATALILMGYYLAKPFASSKYFRNSIAASVFAIFGIIIGVN